ncbi:DNA-binding transcriptional regulator, MarR family [Amycolatopsis xylanica]|uniref:DNA-binding transcriptional regulator, MarR family n=1 Tax=Amycolatopsis xylanica TaxID=589385 RepID=A0A1H2SKH7_9PSEU|nr:MarR family winged helix-turn-helix transcriptional regulator [Amycolatopsis xylanica]SDW31624.1 DNA-binding transcriptional regulator, MarR family [Amycolatopsis xylanica]
MVTRAERNATDPDLGVLSGRLLFAVQRELFTTLAEQGFDDLKHRHGAVLAYLDPEGVRATDLSRLSGQHKQIVGTLIDELELLGYVERRPDPSDRRAKLICPTARGLAQMRAADAIMAAIQDRHARRLGHDEFKRFKRMLTDVTEHQRGFGS